MRFFCLIFLLFLLISCEPEPVPTATAQLMVSNATLSLTMDSPVETLIIRNTGEPGSVLEWSVDTSTSVLVLSTSSGKLAFDKSQEINVTVDTARIVPNVPIVEQLIFNSNGGTKFVWVSFRLAGTGLLACGTYPVEKSSALQPVAFEEPQTPYAAGELLVKYKVPLDTLDTFSQSRQVETAALEINRSYGLTTLKAANLHRPALLQISAGEDVLAMARRLEQDPRIDYAEPNYYLELLGIPNDPLFSDQWNMADFGMPEAWNVQTGSNNIVVAVIDSGVAMDHEDLAEKMLPGCDFFDEDNDPNPGLPNGGRTEHGTHVAGIAAAIGDNATGVAGVAYGLGVRLLPIKIFNDAGGGATIDHLIDALLWAAGIELPDVALNPFPADVINMSLGADPSEVADKLQSIFDATSQVKAKGAIMFAATANGGRSDVIYAPASDANVIAVGSVDANYQRSSFSNYDGDGSGKTVELMAPGGFSSSGSCGGLGNIRSTFPKDDYGCLQGTSMATPYAAGVAALLLSQNPAMNSGQLKNRLSNTAFFDASYMNPGEYGAGIICADRALGAATKCGK